MNGPNTEVGRDAVNYLTDMLHSSHLRQAKAPDKNCERTDRDRIAAVIARVEAGALTDVAAALEPLANEAEQIERAAGADGSPLSDEVQWRRFSAPVGVFRRARNIIRHSMGEE